MKKKYKKKNILRIGKLKHKITVYEEFSILAKEEEYSAEILASNNQYRQACYFLVQAMEKLIRAKIFSRINPNLEYFREKNRNHSLDASVEFLVETISNDKNIQEQVSNQIRKFVLNESSYRFLHNNLRYPFYSERFDSYSILEVEEKDYNILKKSIDSLKIFLNELDKFK